MINSIFYYKKYIPTLLLLVTFSFVDAQKKDSTDSKPKIGIVLSGGGAKGFAHIGVLKVIEKYNIHPDYITGTSMGAIVAALYSMGYTAKQIEDIVISADWDDLLSDDIKLREISILEKNDYPGYPLKIPFSKNDKPTLPSGIIEGQKVQALFSKLVWQSNTYKTFDDFPVPYRCVATDIISGKPYIFSKGNLAEAMRASMAIPTIFVPVDKDSMLLVDGGVTINYPVQQCIDLGADIIIGSYTGFKTKPKKAELKSMVSILTRSSVIEGIKDSKEQVKKANLTIFPDLKNYSASDFVKTKEIIKAGETAASKPDVINKLKQISTLINFPDTIKPYIDTTKIFVDKIVAENCKRIDSIRVIRMSKLQNSKSYTADEIDKAIKKLYSSWLFTKITYYFTNKDSVNTLVIHVQEKPRGEMQVGLHYDNSYGPDILLKIYYNNLFIKSTIGEAKFSISQHPRALFRYKYYPINNRIFEFSANGYLQMSKIPDIIKDQDVSYQLGHFVHTLADINGQIAIAPFRNFVVSAKYGILFNNIMLRDGVELLYDVNSVRFNYNYINFSISLNRLNDNYFPTKGIYFNTFLKYTLNTKWNRPDTSDILKNVMHENIIFNLQWKHYILFFKHFSLIPSLSLGTVSAQAFITEKFFLGGINYSLRPNNYNFPGINTNYISCDSYVTMGLQGQYKFMKKLYLSGGIYHMYFVDYSDFEYDYENEFENNYVTSWSIGAGMQSKFGPIRIIMSKNFYKKHFFWSVNIGIPF